MSDLPETPIIVIEALGAMIERLTPELLLAIGEVATAGAASDPEELQGWLDRLNDASELAYNAMDGLFTAISSGNELTGANSAELDDDGTIIETLDVQIEEAIEPTPPQIELTPEQIIQGRLVKFVNRRGKVDLSDLVLHLYGSPTLKPKNLQKLRALIIECAHQGLVNFPDEEGHRISSIKPKSKLPPPPPLHFAKKPIVVEAVPDDREEFEIEPTATNNNVPRDRELEAMLSVAHVRTNHSTKPKQRGRYK